jgi:hypothetical protein
LEWYGSSSHAAALHLFEFADAIDRIVMMTTQTKTPRSAMRQGAA